MAVRISKKAESPKPATPAVPAIPNARVAAQAPMVYADGVGNVLISPVNSRVTLIVHAIGADNIQRNVPALEIVIPTSALLGFIGQLQEHIRTQGPQLMQAFEDARKQFAQHMGTEKPQP